MLLFAFPMLHEISKAFLSGHVARFVQTNEIQNGAIEQNQWPLFILLTIYYLFTLVWNSCNWFQVIFKIYTHIDSKIVSQHGGPCTTFFTQCSSPPFFQVANLQNLTRECTTWFSNDTNPYVNARLFMTRDTHLFAKRHNNVFVPARTNFSEEGLQYGD